MGNEEKPVHEKILGKLASGQVVVDSQISHLASHSDVTPFLSQALQKISLAYNETFSIQEVEFEEESGKTNLAETEPGDKIIYAQRINHEGLTRFVKGKQPLKINTITVILSAKDESVNITYDPAEKYALVTAFWGRKTTYEPTDPFFEKNKGKPETTEIYRKSVEFWSKHALLYDPSVIIPGTETKICPW